VKRKMEIVYRTASINDYHGVNAVLKESLELHAHALPSLFTTDHVVVSFEQYQAILYYNSTDILVAEHNGRIIGASVVELKYSPPVDDQSFMYTAYIQYFGVRKEWHNYGIGKKLFHRTKEWGRKKGASELQLTVWAFNQKAKSFYENLGLTSLSHLLSTKL